LSYSPTTGSLLGTTFDATSRIAISDTYTRNSYGELASYSAKVGTSPPFYSVTYDDPATIGRDGFGRVKRAWNNVSGTVRDYN